MKLEQMVAWYKQNPVPSAFAIHHPMIIVAAKKVCKGDWRRCVSDAGGITIYNHQKW